jgi:hypothetical protein
VIFENLQLPQYLPAGLLPVWATWCDVSRHREDHRLMPVRARILHLPAISDVIGNGNGDVTGSATDRAASTQLTHSMIRSKQRALMISTQSARKYAPGAKHLYWNSVRFIFLRSNMPKLPCIFAHPHLLKHLTSNAHPAQCAQSFVGLRQQVSEQGSGYESESSSVCSSRSDLSTASDGEEHIRSWLKNRRQKLRQDRMDDAREAALAGIEHSEAMRKVNDADLSLDEQLKLLATTAAKTHLPLMYGQCYGL